MLFIDKLMRAEFEPSYTNKEIYSFIIIRRDLKFKFKITGFMS